MSYKTKKNEILFEFRILGNSQKASALDPETLEEVSIVAPIHASKDYIQKILLQKLKRRKFIKI